MFQKWMIADRSASFENNFDHQRSVGAGRKSPSAGGTLHAQTRRGKGLIRSGALTPAQARGDRGGSLCALPCWFPTRDRPQGHSLLGLLLLMLLMLLRLGHGRGPRKTVPPAPLDFYREPES